MFFNAKNINSRKKHFSKKNAKGLIKFLKIGIKDAVLLGEKEWTIYGISVMTDEVINPVKKYFVKRNFDVTVNYEKHSMTVKW